MKPNHPQLAAIIGRKFNHTPGIQTYNGHLTKWPVTALGPWPTQADVDTWGAEWDALPPEEKDPRLKLRQEIQNATTIAAIKQILMKVVG